MKSRKEINHSYYIRKVKPFREKKQPIGYHSFVCPICKRRSFMRNLKYTTPFSVDMIYFRGDKGIKWFKGVFDADQKKLIVELIKAKIIQAVREFEISAEDLKMVKVEYLRTETPVRKEAPISFQFTPRIPISIIREKREGGVRYG